MQKSFLARIFAKSGSIYAQTNTITTGPFYTCCPTAYISPAKLFLRRDRRAGYERRLIGRGSRRRSRGDAALASVVHIACTNKIKLKVTRASQINICNETQNWY